MDKRLIPWLRGVGAALASMLIYVVPLGFFMALVLLVVAMEEGGEAMAAASVPLTEAILLLSEGVGFHAGSIVLGVTPLLLTVLLILLIRAVSVRTSTDPRAFVSGALVWMLLNRFAASGVRVTLDDGMAVVMLKSFAVYAVGFLLAAAPRMARLKSLRAYLRAHVSAPVRHAVCVGSVVAAVLLAVMLVIGLGTVVAWIVLDHHAMGQAFDALHMQNGSRALMCVMALAWLPNACLWALSWLFGGGFRIGSLAEYTLWSSSAHDLPALPVFALFPQAVDDAALRAVDMAMPLVLGVLVGLAALLMRRGFRIRMPHAGSDMRALLLDFAYPAGAFCISAAVLSVASMLLFWVSNGSLGMHRLAQVGVDVRRSANVVTRPCIYGLFTAWGVLIVVAAAVFAVRWRLARHARPSDSSSSDSSGKEPVEEKTKSTARVVNSTPLQKEKQGDDNEPTVTTGLGVRIP